MAVYKRGKTYWFHFVFDGKRVQKSTKQGNRKAAFDIESAHRTALAKGEVGLTQRKKEKRTVGQLLDALKDLYKNGDRFRYSTQNASLIEKTRRAFGSKLAVDLSEEDVSRYVRQREAAGDRPATTNRVLQCLRAAFKDAKLEPPALLFRDETGNKRKGFFAAADMDRVLANLPDDGLRDFVRFGYITGMRKGEIESLQWENFEDDVLSLLAEDAKDGKYDRTIPVGEGELKQLMDRRRDARSVETADGAIALAKYIFHRGDGQPIGEFRKTWKTACIAAGVGKMICPKCESEGVEKKCPKCKAPRKYQGRIFHDTRRSAVRDLIRAGVPQKTAMEISGHRTISVFNRYNITDETDKRAALRAAENYRKEQQNALVSMNG
jgi:integrase